MNYPNREQLDQPIQLSEILSIDNLKLNKTPGLDGYMAEFYKQFKNQLVPKLLEVFLACLFEMQIPPSY